MTNFARMSRGECHRFHCGAAHVHRGPFYHSTAGIFTKAKRYRAGLPVESALHCREVERGSREVCGE
jgi:hypothetical protein